MEADFEFPLPVTELVHLEEGEDLKKEKLETGTDDRSSGEINVPLSSGWIQKQLVEGRLPPV